MEADIILQDITKQFGEKTVINCFTDTFPKGKTTCIMGPSGVGKTTLLHILLGLERPDSGTITGLENKTLAAVFQEDRLCEEFDAVTNVMIAVSNHMTDQKVKEEFKKVSLVDYEKKPVSNLSGGMRRRVAIVRAILANRDIMVLDEPLKGFDALLKEKMLVYLKDSLRGKTTIIVTHEREEALFLGDKLIELP